MSIRSAVLFDMVTLDVMAYTSSTPVGLLDMPPEATYRQVASNQLLSALLKKEIPADTAIPDRLAKDKFLASNKKCKVWFPKPSNLIDELLIGEFRKEVWQFFDGNGPGLWSSYSDILQRGRTGPGASLGASGESMYAKLFSSLLTSTSKDLYTMYKGYAKLFPEFSNADAIRSENYGELRILNHSSSSFVPKTSSISRMICTEPSLNMFYQQGVGTLISDRLASSFNIDLATQPDLNRLLAKEGSVSGRFSTIDLESASDSISLKLCKWALPQYAYDTLLEIRSPNTLLDGSLVELDMMSTMGNGFTFPLQTALFSCAIKAAFTASGIDAINDKHAMNWACFGDDIICHVNVTRHLYRLLDLLGFTVNSAKSFSEGGFRESCGADWFYGRSVRGVYVKKLDSLQDIVVTINLLNEWSMRTCICLHQAVRYLMSLVPKHKLCFVPPCENNDAGIRVPFHLVMNPKRDGNRSVLYRSMVSVPQKIRIQDSTIHVGRGRRKLIYNPSGLYLSFLLGEIRNCSWTVRQRTVRYRAKLRVTPNWDYVDSDYSSCGSEFHWRRWVTAVEANLND